MTGLESVDYQIARDRIKGNPLISQMAAGVAAVALAGMAHEDGTPWPHRAPTRSPVPGQVNVLKF